LVFILAYCCFAINLTIFKTINFFVLIYRVFLIEFEIVILLGKNLKLINKLYRFLRKIIRIKKAIESSKLNILDKIVKYRVEKKYQDLVFCYLINFELIIEFSKLLNC